MIGIIGLDTRFAKPPGHIRNPATFAYPVRYAVVAGATPQRVVIEADPALLEPFLDAARGLERQGCRAITTACGFLVLFQAELASAVSVPVHASSLLQVPLAARMIGPRQRVGILTARAASLTPRHLAAAGIDPATVRLAGMDASAEFREVILEGRRDRLDLGRLDADLGAAAEAAMAHYGDIGAWVLECTDLAPFSAGLKARTGLPVFDIVTLTDMAAAAVDGLDRIMPFRPAVALPT